MLGPGLWALAASSTAFAVWIGAGVGGSTVVVYVDDLATAGAALLAAGLCALAARRHTGRLRLVWTLFAAACAAWTIGESAWAAYELSGDVPVSSWADVAYLAALPLAAAALLVHPALQGRVLARSRTLVDGLLLAAGVFFLGWALVLEPVGRTADLGSVDGLVTLAYPLGDVVIVFLVVLVIRGLTDVRRLDLWCLLGGLLATTCSDAVYSYLAGVEDFATGGVIDTGWFTGYLAIGLGALVSQPASIAPRTPADSDSLSSAAVLAPFVPMLGALTVVTIRVQTGGGLDGVTLCAALLLVGLVLARQTLLLLDLLARGGNGGVADRILAALGGAAAEPGPDPPTARRA
jgi:hypothetical protein